MKAALILAAVLTLAMPAMAQADEQKPDEQRSQQQNCRIQPGDQQKQTNGKDLTEKLEPCAGVLKPPPTGDQNTTAPPADSGNMPIIKPGETPPQPKSQQN